MTSFLFWGSAIQKKIKLGKQSLKKQKITLKKIPLVVTLTFLVNFQR